MTLDTAPNPAKRVAANMHRAARRMRELLLDLASASYGNRSTPEICDIREIIAVAAEAAASAMDTQIFQILLDVPEQIKLPLARSRMIASPLTARSIRSSVGLFWQPHLALKRGENYRDCLKQVPTIHARQTGHRIVFEV
jgi:hypothetical protein